jgi:hypothetical protein
MLVPVARDSSAAPLFVVKCGRNREPSLDLGDRAANIAAVIAEYNPGDGWTAAI